jgi:Tol biopolymer transport system component
LAKTENEKQSHFDTGAERTDAIFYELSGNLYRLDIATHRNDQGDAATRLSRLSRLQLSPDETRVAYCDSRDGQTDLWTMPIAGGEPTRLTNDADSEQHPLWHPDGEWILYNVYRDGLKQINLTSINGNDTPAQVTRGDSSFELDRDIAGRRQDLLLEQADTVRYN